MATTKRLGWAFWLRVRTNLVYTDIKNLEVVDPEHYRMTEKEIANQVAYCAKNYYSYCV